MYVHVYKYIKKHLCNYNCNNTVMPYAFTSQQLQILTITITEKIPAMTTLVVYTDNVHVCIKLIKGKRVAMKDKECTLVH